MLTTFLASSSSSSSSSFESRKTYWVHRFVPLHTRRYIVYKSVVEFSDDNDDDDDGGRKEEISWRGEVETRTETEYRTSFVSYLLRWKIESISSKYLRAAGQRYFNADSTRVRGKLMNRRELVPSEKKILI